MCTYRQNIRYEIVENFTPCFEFWTWDQVKWDCGHFTYWKRKHDCNLPSKYTGSIRPRFYNFDKL